jgi:hypothetical protein
MSHTSPNKLKSPGRHPVSLRRVPRLLLLNYEDTRRRCQDAAMPLRAGKTLGGDIKETVRKVGVVKVGLVFFLHAAQQENKEALTVTGIILLHHPPRNAYREQSPFFASSQRTSMDQEHSSSSSSSRLVGLTLHI